MLKSVSTKVIFFLSLLLFSISVFASESDQEASSHKDEKYDPVPAVMHHIMDTHGWHAFTYGGHHYTIPLPVILWTENGLVTFMSSAFHHDVAGERLVEKNGINFINHHEKIYELNSGENEAKFDESGHVSNGVRPLDLSITKNVAAMLISVIILLFVFLKTAAFYKKGIRAPRGIAGFMEPIILFVKNDIAIPNIGEKKHMRFMPYLLTIFFFIWFNNLLGLIPIPGLGGANVTGNIAVTLVLATMTFIITTISGNKHYWSHVLWMPGVPAVIKVLLITPIEIAGLFIKPIALLIRLFANMTAGHIVVLSLISLIFVAKTAWMGTIAVPFTLFISVLELLVALLQAYIFTMLSALFIGSAVVEHH